MFHLAPELVDLIVDNVEASEDLKALSLVCRTFVPNIQWRIFRRLTLASDTLPRLSVVLSASPHIGAYVRDLHINLNIGNSQIHAPLARTLRLLSRVNRVAISTADWQFWYWNSCPKELHTALISLMSLPTMRCLALVRCCGVPAALIRHAIGAYKEVVLQVADIDFKRKLKFVPSGNGESLRRLVLPDYSPVETPDFHTLMLSDEVKASSTHLQHLEMVIPLRNFEGLDDVIVKHAASLQRLTLVYPCTSRTNLAPRRSSQSHRFSPPSHSPATRSPSSPFSHPPRAYPVNIRRAWLHDAHHGSTLIARPRSGGPDLYPQYSAQRLHMASSAPRHLQINAYGPTPAPRDLFQSLLRRQLRRRKQIRGAHSRKFAERG